MVFPGLVERLSDVHKSRKSPVTLSLVESVIGSMGAVYRRVAWIPKHECKLYASVPVFRRFSFESVLQVERCTLHLIAKWEKQNPPRMASAVKDRSFLPSRQLSPSFNTPGMVCFSFNFSIREVH